MARGGSSNGDSAVARASRAGRTRLRSVATGVACSRALNPATGAGLRPRTFTVSLYRSPTENERPALVVPRELERYAPRGHLHEGGGEEHHAATDCERAPSCRCGGCAGRGWGEWGKPTIVLRGKKATIVGSGLINGRSGDDVIVGSAGDDVINAGGGNDRVCAKVQARRRCATTSNAARVGSSSPPRRHGGMPSVNRLGHRQGVNA